ncbi:MAG TPA: TlpA disulfide reductase family protein [Candidatus Sulfopaludibacter sp.]|jgi:thiol-disulfide isomerase/thioredoxin|nr:TlpA disulfide reductase family protein [Candidatus Sulfopaludibacter sp.]
MQTVKIDRLLRVAICVLLAAFVYVVYAGIHQPVIAAGDSAPKFTITTDAGRTVTLPNFGGKVLILNFWASWCPPCVQETPSLSRLAQEYGGKGLVVLGVSVDKDPNAYQGFLKKYQPAFLTARELSLHEDFGTFMYPETYIIDANGKVLKKIAEGVDWNDPGITQYINSLL